MTASRTNKIMGKVLMWQFVMGYGVSEIVSHLTTMYEVELHPIIIMMIIIGGAFISGMLLLMVFYER